MMKTKYWLCAALSIVLISCGQVEPTSTETLTATEIQVPIIVTDTPSFTPTVTLPMELTSPVIQQGGTIPDEIACTGANLSPQLDWTESPAGTQSFALIFNDPDASSRGFVHWVLFNIAGDARSLPAAVPSGAEVLDGVRHGLNSWGRMDYGGPCPPEGSTHNYVLTLYALDAILDLRSGTSKDELLAAMEGHVLAEAELSASFGR